MEPPGLPPGTLGVRGGRAGAGPGKPLESPGVKGEGSARAGACGEKDVRPGRKYTPGLVVPFKSDLFSLIKHSKFRLGFYL